MTPERYEQVCAIFNAARRLPPAQQPAFLDQRCAGDADLRAEAEKMLAAAETATRGGFLEPPTELEQLAPKLEPPDPNLGLQIGTYKLLEKIGEGGFGLVYRAEQRGPVERVVALKLLKPGMDGREIIARFESERQALALMNHPNVAAVHDAGATSDGRPYFVMEYVAGVPLTAYCDEHKLGVRARLELAIQICQAVQHAHQKGVIHRDLKPDNILVTVQNGRPVPKVIDFGIAKAMDRKLTDKTLFTEVGRLMGTPAYMSPEQAGTSGLDIDTRTDIYALGAILYELLTSTLPFTRETLRNAGYAEIQRIIREVEPPNPSTRLGQLGAGIQGVKDSRIQAKPNAGVSASLEFSDPQILESALDIARRRQADPKTLLCQVRGDLDWIVMKCLEKDRTRRYASVEKLADDLQKHLDGLPVDAGPPSVSYRLSKFVRKHRIPVVAALLVFLSLLGGLLGMTALYVRATAAERQKEEERKKAVAAETAANDARRNADEQKQRAEERAEDLRRKNYVNAINLAARTYEELNIGRMKELLAQCDADLRGWEWRRLRWLSDCSLRTFTGHAARVTAAAFSPDGRRIVSGSEDNTLKLWDVETGQVLHTLKGHRLPVQAVAFSPDGRRIVSGSHDRTLKLWDAETGQELRTLRGHTVRVTAAAFSPDGRRIVSGSWDGTLKLWDATTGKELGTLDEAHASEIKAVAFSPNGQQIVSGSLDNTLKLWDAETGDKLRTSSGHTDGVGSLSFSPDGRQIVSGGGDSTLKLWDAETGQELRTFKGHTTSVWTVAFSPDGRRIVSGSADDTLKLWDVESGQPLRTFRGHTSWVLAVSFSSDGRRIVSGGADHTLKLWDASIGQELRTFKGHTSSVTAISFHPDNRRFAWGGNTAFELWDAETGQELRTFVGHSAYVSAVAFSSDGRRIVSGSEDNTLKLWDVETGQVLHTLKGHTETIKAVAFSPNSRQIVSGSNDRTLKLWDAETGQELRTLKGHMEWISAAVFSPDNQRIVSGSIDGMLKLWDAETGQELRTLKDNMIAAAVFSPKGRQILLSYSERTLKFWDAETGQELRTLKGHADLVSAAAFSPDGRRIVSGSWDGTLKIWDAETGDELLTLRCEQEIGCVAFGANCIVAGCDDGTLVIWDAPTPAAP